MALPVTRRADTVQRSAFELNVPRSIGPVLERLAGMTPTGFADEVAFDQIHYIIQGHGGHTNPDPARLPDLLDESVPQGAGRVHLFDPHGEDGKVIRSGLFNPFWTSETAARITGTPRGDGGKAPGADSTKPNPDAGPAVDGGSSPFNGMSGDAGSEQFNGGGGEQGSDQFNGSGGDSGSAEYSGGNGTSGSGEYSGGEQSSGSSKTLWFPESQFAGVRRESSRAAVSDRRTPEGVLWAGEVITYVTNNQTLSGVHRLKLPAGRSTDAPTLLLLQSCFGTPEIASVLDGGDGLGRTVVTLSSRDPIHIGLLQYDALGMDDYLALPVVLAEGLSDSASPNHGRAKSIVRHFAEDGLDRTPLAAWGIDQPKEKSCKLQVHVVRPASSTASARR